MNLLYESHMKNIVLFILLVFSCLSVQGNELPPIDGERAYLFPDERLNTINEWRLNTAYQRVIHKNYIVVVEVINKLPVTTSDVSISTTRIECNCRVISVIKGNIKSSTIKFQFVPEEPASHLSKDTTHKLIICFDEINNDVITEISPDVFLFDLYNDSFEKVIEDLNNLKNK